MTSRARTALLVAVVAWTAFASAEEPRVDVSVRFPVQQEPAEAVLVVIVPRHADNRWLWVEISGDEFMRGGLEQLDGLRARRAREVRFTGVPAGEYEVVAELQTSGGRTWRDTARMEVIGRAMRR